MMSRLTSIEELSVDVELKVIGCSVSDANRLLSLMSIEVRQLILGHLLVAMDSVHDLESPILVAVADDARKPLDVLCGGNGQLAPTSELLRENLRSASSVKPSRRRA